MCAQGKGQWREGKVWEDGKGVQPDIEVGVYRGGEFSGLKCREVSMQTCKQAIFEGKVTEGVTEGEGGSGEAFSGGDMGSIDLWTGV